MRRLTSMALVALVASAAVAAGAPAGAPLPLDVFVIAGQSNAAGYGQPVPEHERPDPRILDLLHPNGARPAVDPLWGMGYRQPGVGPGRFFAQYLVHHARVRVGLIDCAVGGTPLEDWLPGTDPRRPSLYDQCARFTRLVLSRHPVARLAGVVFSQGETDSQRLDRASAWEQRFATFVLSFRRDLGARRLPIVMQQTVDFVAEEGSGPPYTGEIRRVVLVNADGLPLAGEHFTVPGYSMLGGLMAEAWLAAYGPAG